MLGCRDGLAEQRRSFEQAVLPLTLEQQAVHEQTNFGIFRCRGLHARQKSVSPRNCASSALSALILGPKLGDSMRLGKDVLESDLYGELGLLPDATESEIRVAYRQQVRTSHPDLNRDDPDAAKRMTRLNVAAKVLLDPALRRAYDRVPRGVKSASPSATKAPKRAAWFERREQNTDNDWTPPRAPTRQRGASFGSMFGEL